MLGRRRLLEAAALGWVGSSLGVEGRLFARDPRPREKSSTPLEADERVNRVLGQARTDGRRLPGMIGAVVRGEDLVGVGAVGLRKIGSTEPIRVEDAVHFGSCTKAMTSTMIGTLVDEGKLRWDSTIGEVFPEQVGASRPEYQPVTLQQLLDHRSGLPHDIRWRQAIPGLSIVDQRLGLMAGALRVAPESKPGSTYSYSNTGYVLAGMMAERVTGTPWEDLMRRRVFGPLGMTSAGFGPPGSARGQVDHAWGHRASGVMVEAVHQDNPAAMGPAGTVHGTIRDWARFASFHLRGSLGGTRLLKPETLKALHTPRPGEDYAGGWMVADRSWAGGRTLNHNGSNTLWFCTIWIALMRDFAVLVATNAGGPPAQEACDQAVKGLIRLANPDDRGRRRGD